MQGLRQLSTDAKVLYGLMLDRMGLSLRNGWFDEEGRVYIYFSVEEIMAMLGCANAKCTKLLQELDSENGIGLITRVKQGLCKPDVIYVHKCINRISESNARTFENQISGGLKSTSQGISKSNANDNYMQDMFPVYRKRIFRPILSVSRMIESKSISNSMAGSLYRSTQTENKIPKPMMLSARCRTMVSAVNSIWLWSIRFCVAVPMFLMQKMSC